ncbi:uncharacterized protein LOC128337208 isoform X2 [Hemicordylus capensis]|uniref:uncharacterized protein LOC128337208 isoform X2 n=1 Tax=Hemicordylus capensis TaxID=884348 RepID=UPI0023028F88|nr:uncharacterized protein LOC128337208 isoform X2 [Hemicordylus capensis]
MAALRRLGLLAWVLLSGPLARVGGGDATGVACEQQLRFRERGAGGASEPGEAWGPTVALLSSACAAWVFVFYALRCLCEAKRSCAQQGCAEDGKSGAATWGSQATACSQPRCGSRAAPECRQAQQVYARQLARMEQELKGFLCEVQSRRLTLQAILGEEERPEGCRWDADKLRITVYETADCEGPGGGARARGQKRQLK